MKILHALEHSLPRLAGYTIRSKYIVDNQRSEGIEPVVITSPLQEQTGESFKSCEEINGIRYYRTGEFNKLDASDPLLTRLLKRYSYSKAYSNAIRWVAEKEDIQIIHSHSSYLNGVRGNEAARKIGIPSVYEVRGFWQDTAAVNSNIDTGHWKYKFVDHMDRKAMLGADRVITISSHMKKEILEKGVKEEALHVVPNGVDTNIFRPREKNNELLNQYGLLDKIVFGFIGSIRRIEGISFFLENLNKLIEKDDNVRVLLVGDGDEVRHLKEITEERNLGKYVIFAGRVDHEKILEYYSIIDIFFYPRIDAKVNHKVTPLKPLEAMAMEKVVLASDVGGLKELINDGENGMLFRVGNAADLLEKCLSLIKKHDLRQSLAVNARSWVARERDWATIIKLYNSIYSELVPY